ncbi:MAG TPA: ribonuclease R [Steroidobacteraceae bacterium]|nr:ribonuclease R [Steroidobacteraceae bacterium]
MKKTQHWRDRDPHHERESGRYADPIPSREMLLEELHAARRPLAAEVLARRLEIRKAPLKSALAKRLTAMTRDGSLIVNREHEYSPALTAEAIEGIVLGHKDGFGFLRPDRGPPDIFLSHRQMQGLFPRDRAAVRIVRWDSRGRPEGAITRVLTRGTLRIAGRLRDEGELAVVIPEDPRFVHRVAIPPAHRNGTRDGDWVEVEITEQPRADALPIGKVVRRLEAARPAAFAAELAIVAQALPTEFSEAAMGEANAWPDAVSPLPTGDRWDLTKLKLVTIDGDDARDFDDAVYCEPAGEGWRLIVAIADVAHYVCAGGALDDAALERSTSVYFPDRVIPMLPEKLSNGLCSLKPDVPRLCVACEMHVNPRGKITRSGFRNALMHSAARLTYTEVGAMLDGKVGGPHDRLRPQIERLREVFRALRKARHARGALDFDAPEIKPRLGDRGEVVDLVALPRNDAHKLVEECMIAANVAAAGFLRKHKLPCLYRVHGEPESRKIAELQKSLAALGIGVKLPETLETRDLQEVAAKIGGRPDAAFIESLIIRSQQQALYQPANIGHFGLALTEYAHFTSPIRRYPDLVVHRAIKHAIAGGHAGDFVYGPGHMDGLGRECSSKERRADEAMRGVQQYLKCEYLRRHLGEEFDATITGVVDFGFFAQITALQIDGLVHVSSLRDDDYYIDDRLLAWCGQRGKRRYQLGQRIRIRVVKVDLDERQVDFEVAAAGAPARAHPAKSRRRRG